MAFNPAPGTWLGAGYSVAANAITMNTNDAATNKTLTELTDVEAHATTGDIRKVIFALQEKLWAAWLAIAVADRPAKMTINRSSSTNDITGVVTKTFVIQFSTDVLTQDVSDEA